jgi:long-chain fatty acid transport protein
VRGNAKRAALSLLVGLVWQRPALGQDCSEAASIAGSTSVIQATLNPPDVQLVRPDLSNPGARALGLGGAFVSTADDATSAVANPGGLGSLVKPQVQVEGRYRQLSEVRQEGTGVINSYAGAVGDGEDVFKDKSIPVFASGVFPFGDIFVAGLTYQTVYTVNRDVDQVHGAFQPGVPAAPSGPCFQSFQTPPQRYYTLLRNYHEDAYIYRVGPSFAVRAAPGFSIGVSVFANHEHREQKILVGDALGLFNPFYGLPSDVNLLTESWKVSFILGALLNIGENVRLGASYSSKVAFDDANKVGNTSTEQLRTVAFLPTTLPSRASLGLTFSPSSALSVSVEGVYVFTKEDQPINVSAISGTVTIPALLNPDNYKIDSTYEARLGLEWTFLQSRTQKMALRLGGWFEKITALEFVSADRGNTFGETVALDSMRIALAPLKTDKLKHGTLGFGMVLNKQWQFDLGGDYEFERQTFTGSLLAGYSF